jgi:hypothetical protein
MKQPYERFRCACGEFCVMVPHEGSGKPAPITVAPYDGGNVDLVLRSVNAGQTTYRIVGTAERVADPRPRFVNHFSNCPLREDFGGRPGREEGGIGYEGKNGKRTEENGEKIASVCSTTGEADVLGTRRSP